MAERVQFRMEIDGKFGSYEGELVRKENGQIWMVPDKAFENPRLGDSHLLNAKLLVELEPNPSGLQYRYKGVIAPKA